MRRATYAEQLAQSNLHRAACTEQLAGSAICTEQLAGSHLQGPTCRSNLRGATCAEQLAQCNLRRATCADQLAPTSLRRAPCLVLSRACFTNASRREKERILQRWADLACDVLLSGQPWSSSFLRLTTYEQNLIILCTRKLGQEFHKVSYWFDNRPFHKSLAGLWGGSCGFFCQYHVRFLTKGAETEGERQRSLSSLGEQITWVPNSP